MTICQCDKSVIETLGEEVELLGCPEGDPGCSQVPDNTTFLSLKNVNDDSSLNI